MDWILKHPFCSSATLALAVVVVAVAWMAWRSPTGFSCKWTMGSADLDLSKSWGLTTAFTAGIMNLALGGFFASVDTAKRASIEENALLFLLTGLASCLFNALRKVEIQPGPPQRVVYAGYVCIYLLASALTLFCAFGQLLVFIGRIPANDADFKLHEWLAGAAWLYIAALVLYSVRTIYWTVRSQRPATGEEGLAAQAQPVSYPLL